MGVSSMILVSILEGKNFPVRNDKLLSVEARFDGEVMSTEIVPHNIFPNFNTELGWEVDKKGLQMHRLQRTPIKLQCYALDKDLSRKECIGYIVLDMRLAQENTHHPKWHPLLNCKYHDAKPEILLTMFLEREPTSQVSVATPKDKAFNGTATYTVSDLNMLRKNVSNLPVAKTIEKSRSNSTIASPSTLEAMFIPELAGYRIGPPNMCNEKFQFSVMVAFAANLNKLAPPAALRTSKEFYFCYSIFENTVRTGRFASLANPDFLAERASVFISSSADILSTYFTQHPHLEVTLYCGDSPLAVGKIPLGLLATVNEHEIDKKPLLIEGSVQVYPIEKPKAKTEDLSPFVGVTVVLQKVQNMSPSVEQVTAVQKLPKTVPEVTPPGSSHSSNHVIPQRPSSITQNYEEINGNNTLYNERCQNRLSQNRTRMSSTSTSRSETPGAGGLSQNSSHNATPKSPPKSSIAGDRMPSSRNLNGHADHVPNDNVPHYFCFSLDLCNFRATHVEIPVSLFIRYTYPFFGASTAICTQAMDVAPGLDVTIPQGFCQFKFATTANLLKSTFQESPLILEVVQRKKQGSNRMERLAGTAKLNLFQVLDAVAIPQVIDKRHATKRMCTCKVIVMSSDGREMAEIQVVVKLDDFGPTSNLCDKLPNKSKTYMPQLRSSVSSFDVTSVRQNGYNNEELLQAALEVEVWKERQKEIFRSELKDKEMQHLKVLVTEWKQRDTEREILLQRRLHECQKLEDKLKQMLQDAEIKEKHVAAQEADLSLRSESFDRQQEQQERESSLQMQKMKADYNELVRHERINVLEAEEKINSLQRKIKEQEDELMEQKNLIHTMKLQLNKQPDVELKTEVNILKMEKTELIQRLETLLSSKQKYKVQWANAIRQISLLQQDGYRNGVILTKKNDELSKKNEEITMLKQLVPTEPKVVSEDKIPYHTPNNDTQEQDDVLSTHSNNKDESTSSQSIAETLSLASHPLMDKDTETALNVRTQNLITQRDKLLESRIYSEKDAIIQKLTEHIEQAQSSST